MSCVPRNTPAWIGWLLPGGTLFFLCGILLSRIIRGPWLMLIALGLGLISALISRCWRRYAAGMLMALALGSLMGWTAYHPVLPPEGDYTVAGTVSQMVVQREDGQVQTVLSGVQLNGDRAPDAYWTFYIDPNEGMPDWLVPGARIQTMARMYHPQGLQNPGCFDFSEYLLQRGIGIGLYGADELTQEPAVFSLKGGFAALRHRLAMGMMEVMGEEHGAYAAAMILGTRDFIPEDDRAAFSRLGIAHVLSVSGFHTGVLIGLMMLLMRPLPLYGKRRLLVEALVLVGYCLLSGGNVPVIRAMGLLLWRELSRIRHRQVLPLHALSVIALAQLAGNPSLAVSPSFQLSYGAMVGLWIVYPWLRNARACTSGWGRRCWHAFSAAVSAQLGTLMPQLYWFGELPLLGVLLNMMIVPFAGLLIILYWLTLAVLPVPGLNMALGTAAAKVTAVLLDVVEKLNTIQGVTLWIRQPGVIPFIGWTLLLIGLSILLPCRALNYRRALCLAGAVLLAAVLVPLPETSVSYIQFDVGNEEAALLQDQDMTVVIDAGSDGRTVAEYLHQRRQSVEMLIITHLHLDHGGGIQALLAEGIPVKVCCLPWAAETPVIDAEVIPLIEALRESGTEICYLSRGDVISLPSGQLTVLWPEKGRVFSQHDANDVNLVLQAELAGTTMLLTGDLTSAYASYAAQPSDILKVAHHGSENANSPELLSAIAPQLLLLSNSEESRDAYMGGIAGDTPLYTTSRCGAVTIRFLGNGEFEVSAYRQEQTGASGKPWLPLDNFPVPCYYHR